MAEEGEVPPLRALKSDDVVSGLAAIDRTLDGRSVAYTALSLAGLRLTSLWSDTEATVDPLLDSKAVAEAEAAAAAAGEGDDGDDGGEAAAGAKAAKSALADFIHVRYLDCSRNKIADLSPVSSLRSLLALSAEGNAVERLPNLSALRYLQVLNLAHNQLRRLDGMPSTAKAEGEEDEDAGGGGDDEEEEGKEEEPAAAEPELELAPQPFKSGTIHHAVFNGNKLESLEGLLTPALQRLEVAGNALAGKAVFTAAAAAAEANDDRVAGGEALYPSLYELIADKNQLESLDGLLALAPRLRLLSARGNQLATLGGLVGKEPAPPAPAEDGDGDGEEAEAAEEAEAVEQEDHGLADDAGGKWGEQAFRAEGAPAWLRTLRVIDLADNQVEDIKELYHLRRLRGLRAVNFDGNPCCDAGPADFKIEVLIRVGPHIEVVNNDEVTTADLEEAAKESARRVEERSAARRERAEDERQRRLEAEAAAAAGDGDDDE